MFARTPCLINLLTFQPVNFFSTSRCLYASLPSLIKFVLRNRKHLPVAYFSALNAPATYV